MGVSEFMWVSAVIAHTTSQSVECEQHRVRPLQSVLGWCVQATARGAGGGERCVGITLREQQQSMTFSFLRLLTLSGCDTIATITHRGT